MQELDLEAITEFCEFIYTTIRDHYNTGLKTFLEQGEYTRKIGFE